MQLCMRKKNMRRLFERMQAFQFEKVQEQPDKALTEDSRSLQEEDIQRWESGGIQWGPGKIRRTSVRLGESKVCLF